MIPYRAFFTHHWKRILIWTAAALALFTLVGFFVVPPILKSVLTKQLTAALHRDVSIREVRVNPFALSATLRGLTVKERSGPETFASFDELYVNLESFSVLRLAVIVREFRLTKPFIRIVRHPEQSYNFSDLLAGSTPPKPENQKPAKPPRFSINNIRIVDGSADILDEVAQKKHSVREVNIGVPFISNISSYIQIFVQPGISAQVNGTRYAIEGKTKPFADTHETTLDVNFADLELPYYLAYVPQEFLTFAMPSGRMDAKLVIVFVQQKASQSLVVKGDIGFRNIAIDEKKGGPLLRLPSLGISIASAEPLALKVHLAKVALESPELTLRRDNTGTTNLEALLPKQEPPKQTTEKTPAPQGEGLILDVDEVSIAGAKILVSDLLPRLPFKTTLAPIDLKVLQLSNRQGAKGTYSMASKTEAKEEIALEGTVSLRPIAVEGSVNIKSLLLKKYTPYYSDTVLFDIESGNLDLFSRYRYIQGEKEPEIGASEAAVTLSALRLKRREESEDFLRIATLAVKDATLDVSKREIVVGGLSTQKGFLRAKRLANGDIDLQKLTPPPPTGAGQTTTAAAGSEQKPWAITLKRLLVDQYAATLEDRTTPEPITLAADKIRLTGENLSTAKNATGKLSLALLLDQGANISTSTTVGLDPLKADGRLEVAGMVLKRYAPYYRDKVAFDIQDGILDLATGYRVSQGKDAFDVKLAGLATTLRTLRLKMRDGAQEFLTIPSLAIKDTGVDLSQQDVLVGDLSTEGGTILVSRSRKGEISLAKLLPPTAAVSPPAGSPAVVSTTAAADKAARPWKVKAGAISVNRYSIQVTDEVPAEPVSLVVEDLNLKAQNLSTVENQPPGKVSLALRLGKGSVSFDGTASIAPVSADLQLDVKEIDIRPFQPYFTDKVKITVADGHVSTSGHLELSLKEPAGLQAKFTGEATLGKFAAIEKTNAEDILNCESLALHDLSVGYNPLFVHAKKVALADFFAHVIIQPGGRLNLQEIVATSEPVGQAKPAQPSPPAAQTAKADAPAQQVAASATTDTQIEELTLQGGRVQFLDRTLKPNYSALMTEIGGRVTGLSSLETSLADVELRGRINNSAPLEITGKVNPLKQDLYADIRARFTGMDLSPTSPYSGKYVGYVIEKGKLSFDLKYLIDKRKLTSENKVFIDQFTFGDKIDSPTATRLPVKLAVALLKDRNGEIHLDIPVNGSIDDPQFSIWGVIWQIIGNLITKAVTSPFALLGSAFGGGEGLQYLEFDPGLATIPADGVKKVDSLVAALSEKPSLKLEITGYAAPEADREGLKRYFLQRKVKAQKLNDLVKKGAPAVPVDEVSVGPEEYEKYLTLAYRAEKFPKPRNFVGLVKGLPVAEMEKLMLTHIEAGEEELHQLAAQRANAVRDAILKSGKVDAERLFIVEPKGLAPEKKENVKESRVEFKIA